MKPLHPLIEPPMTADPRLARIVHFFETLTPATLAGLDEVYTADARFKDPFQCVEGSARIRRVYAHMFETLSAPRFIVQRALCEGPDAFLSWDLVFDSPRMPDGRWTVHGASHLRLAADGRIAEHRDYWDPAEELYEKTPLLGALMRLIKRRLRTPGL